MLQTHSGHLWLEGETVIGIGEIRGNEICTVAVTRQGCGEAMVRALVERIEGQAVVVQTASTNLRAIRLYERGFQLVFGEKTQRMTKVTPLLCRSRSRSLRSASQRRKAWRVSPSKIEKSSPQI